MGWTNTGGEINIETALPPIPTERMGNCASILFPFGFVKNAEMDVAKNRKAIKMETNRTITPEERSVIDCINGKLPTQKTTNGEHQHETGIEGRTGKGD